MMQSNDPRLMSAEELEDYANEFQSQISSGLYDVSIIRISFNNTNKSLD